MLGDLPALMAEKIAVLPTGCWQWTGAIQSKGYGSFQFRGRTRSTHRLAYELLVAPIPAGLQIDHLCRNRACCNPAHLEPVTAGENHRRAPHTQVTRCPAGHPYAGDNLIVKHRPGRGVNRNCRTCANTSRRAKRRAASRDLVAS
ncbi:hypothetical protein GS4_41_00410 [Gordonia soli NBRC 108243]|uniref:HNH nuclease domain-containing protein n=2 Tax=Gordonia soli TaxID=320799 RepID=M0QQX4_9ACTN|nr:hypothetical protein GS4_41_00410 [Gordonia soli NBRC 108243]